MPTFTEDIILTDVAGDAATRLGRAGGLVLGPANLSTQGVKSGGLIHVRDKNGRVVFRVSTLGFAPGGAGRLTIGSRESPGSIYMLHQNGGIRISLDGSTGNMRLSSGTGIDRIIMNGSTGNMRVRGNIRVGGDILLENADCAEEFDTDDEQLDIEPGTVMVVTEEGILTPSTRPYDKKVAGIVSGKDKDKPAIVLNKQTPNNKRVPIALIGRVFCKVDAIDSPIEVGDLLTTSSTKGHAMKASDPMKAFGAVIGKALRTVREDTEMIPILVALQ